MRKAVIACLALTGCAVAAQAAMLTEGGRRVSVMRAAPVKVTDFIASPSMPAHLSLARADAVPVATYRNGSGNVTLVSGATDARYDHDSSGAPRGLLLERASVNLLASADLGTGWVATRASIVSNQATGADGTTSADKLLSDATASNNHNAQLVMTFTSGTKYALSGWAKPTGPYTWFQARFPSSAFGASQIVNFNLTGSGAVGTTSGGGSPVASIASDVSGLYRFKYVSGISATSTIAASAQLYLEQADNTITFNGDSATAVLLDRLQVEPGNYPTSTMAGAGVRAADVLTMTGYASNPVSAQVRSVATGAISCVTYADQAAFNTAMSGPDVWLQKVLIWRAGTAIGAMDCG